MNRKQKSHRQKSLFWKRIAPNPQWVTPASSSPEVVDNPVTSLSDSGSHALVDDRQNQWLRDYEMEIKTGFDSIQTVLKSILAQSGQADFIRWANQQLFAKLGVTLTEPDWQKGLQLHSQTGFQVLYGKTLFAQFMKMSQDFFEQDPLAGRNKQQAERIFNEAGFHAVGIAPCADGRLAHILSYVLRLPYSLVRRKAHAGALFDVSESVRNWVFIEHKRFREGLPNSADDPTRYLKIAVYHFSKADPTHQGCAAHGSDDQKAAQAALQRLNDFKQAIENRFGCGSTVQTLLLGLNTDDDSLKVHVPDAQGAVSLARYVETETLYRETQGMVESQAWSKLEQALVACNQAANVTAPEPGLVKLLAWLMAQNFSQIAYVNQFENGCYSDLGHAERFIGIGNGFEEVQLRNLSYYSFLDTVEEGVNDVDVGIKIFKGLNVKKGWPIPIIIRCDYDGRVPGSKDRAEAKAVRIEKALHNRYQELSASGLLQTLPTLRDFTGHQAAELLPGLAEMSVQPKTA
ncbi:MAG: carboxysome shell carbonic anhydrase [Hydrogenovibrio sp.]